MIFDMLERRRKRETNLGVRKDAKSKEETREGRRVDTLAHGGDEGRDKLR